MPFLHNKNGNYFVQHHKDAIDDELHYVFQKIQGTEESVLINISGSIAPTPTALTTPFNEATHGVRKPRFSTDSMAWYSSLYIDTYPKYNLFVFV